MRARVGFGWALFMLSACGSDGSSDTKMAVADASAADASPSAGAANDSPTWPSANLREVEVPAPPPLAGAPAPQFSQVRQLLAGRCTNSPACHSSGQPQNLDNVDLATDPYDTLLQGTSSASGKAFVVAGDPQKSYLYEKIAVDQPTVGSRMPLGPQGLTEEQIVMIGQWIAAGALND